MFTPQLRAATEKAIASAFITAQGKMPQPIQHAKKCQSCSLMGICLPFEVQHLLQENT
jgi:CRISPR-associated exonuclease Cas4